MSGNRVEELEAKVRELEATIEGLTDELVETKERLGTIEDEAGIEPGVLQSRYSKSRSKTERMDAERDERSAAESDAETETETEADVEEGEETTDSSGDDIIVA